MSTCVFWSDEYLSDAELSASLSVFNATDDVSMWYVGRKSTAANHADFRRRKQHVIISPIEPRWAQLPLSYEIMRYLDANAFDHCAFVGCPGLAYRAAQAKRMGLMLDRTAISVADDGLSASRRREPRFPAAPTEFVQDFMEAYALRFADAVMPDATAVASAPPAASHHPAQKIAAAANRVSAIMAFYNDSENLELSLHSLTEQDSNDLHEIVIVDDGSDDREAENARALVAAAGDSRVRLLRQPINRGAGAARNRGLDAASGELCVFFDSDNLAHPGMFGKLAAAWRASGADFVIAASERTIGDRSSQILTAERRTIAIPAGPIRALGFLWNVFGDIVFIGLREQILACGPFTDRLVEDWEFLSRAALRHVDIDVLPEPVYQYLVKPAKHVFRETHKWQKANKMIRLYEDHIVHNPDLVPQWLRLICGQYDALATQRLSGDASNNLYHRLAKTSEQVMRQFLTAGDCSSEIPTWKVFDKVSRYRYLWEDEGREVFVYGAGEHSKCMLALCPWLFAHITAFIDRGGGSGRRFLGLPVISPADYAPAERHVIIYSSRKHEASMYLSLATDKPVHLRLYAADSADAAVAPTLHDGSKHD